MDTNQCKSKHVLIVEDNSAHRKVFGFYFAKAGFRVTTAVNGRDALKVAEQADFDLVVTDYYMPVMSGCEFVTQLRKIPRYARTPVILITCVLRELDADYLRNELLVFPIAKPCPIRELVAAASKCLAASSGPGSSSSQPSPVTLHP